MEALKCSFSTPALSAISHYGTTAVPAVPPLILDSRGKKRMRLITFHYDNAALGGPAVGTADCRLGHFQTAELSPVQAKERN